MSTKMTKKQAEQFVDALNDMACDYMIDLPTIPTEEARDTAREPLNKRIVKMLAEVVKVMS